MIRKCLLASLLVLVACSLPGEEVEDCIRKGANPTPCKNPVVLVPGLGATILDALYQNSYEPIHEDCEPDARNEWSSGMDRLWPAIQDAFPEEVPELGELRECRLDDLRVRFDKETGHFSNAPGVRVRPRGWGCVDGISNLFAFNLGDRELIHPTMSSVYEMLIERLTEEHGYVIGRSLVGAPYDFRMVADDGYLDGYYAQLKALIEATYESTSACKSGNKRVFVLGHSLGGPVLLHFLNTYVDAAWKGKYIRAFISIGSPWTGSPKAYRSLLSGDREGMPGDNLEFLAAERLMGGLLWMAPSQAHHGDRDFVSVDGVEYGVSPEDIDKVFGEIAGSPHQAHLLNEVLARRSYAVADPKVLVGCLYGVDLPTGAHYAYQGGGFHGDPVVDQTVSGDGTVTRDVLEHCKSWEQVAPRAFEGGDHLDLLHRGDFLDHTAMLITSCWREHPGGIRSPACPELPTAVGPAEP